VKAEVKLIPSTPNSQVERHKQQRIGEAVHLNSGWSPGSKNVDPKRRSEMDLATIQPQRLNPGNLATLFTAVQILRLIDFHIDNRQDTEQHSQPTSEVSSTLNIKR
jgi:hypothetical protein